MVVTTGVIKTESILVTFLVALGLVVKYPIEETSEKGRKRKEGERRKERERRKEEGKKEKEERKEKEGREGGNVT